MDILGWPLLCWSTIFNKVTTDLISNGRQRSYGVTVATQIVDKILGEAFDHEAMLRELGDEIEKDRVTRALRASGDIVIRFGFYIGTGDQGMMEDNLREDGVDPNTVDWNRINNDLSKIECNMLAVLRKNGLELRDEGHGTNNDLGGSAWLHTKLTNDNVLNDVGIDLLKDMVDSGEPLTTGSGSIMSLKGSDGIFAGVSDLTARICEVSFGIFATENLKAFF